MPRDVIRLTRPNGSPGAWEVQSVLLGALGHESVYGVRVIDLAAPADEFGLRVTEMYVPTVFVDRLVALGEAVVVERGEPTR